MAEIYTNLPRKSEDNLDKTKKQLTEDQYIEEFQFNAGEYDAVIGFFVKRGFGRAAAESVAIVILQQAKIDEISASEILDKITYADPAQLSELVTVVLNENRYRSSRLGVRKTLTTNQNVSRNILD